MKSFLTFVLLLALINPVFAQGFANGNGYDNGLSSGGSGTSSQWTGTGTGNLTYTKGNVGIGSANPGQQLDVTGTVRATNFTGGIYTNLATITGATPNNAAVDNQPFIQTCLNDTTTSVCYVPKGTWYIDHEINMPTSSFYDGGKVLLLDSEAIIKPFASYQTDPGNSGAIILLGNKCRVTSTGHGTIDVSGVSGGYTGAMIYSFSGQQASNGTGADNIQLIDSNNTSYGVLLYADSNGVNDGIYSNNFHDLFIYGTNRAIGLIASSDFGQDIVNGNMFYQIFIAFANNGLWLDQGNGGAGQEVYANMFNNIYFQSTTTTVDGIHCAAWTNSFTNVQLWDIPVGGHGYNFTANSAYNTLSTWNNFIEAGGAPTTNVDLGTQNYISGNFFNISYNSIFKDGSAGTAPVAEIDAARTSGWAMAWTLTDSSYSSQHQNYATFGAFGSSTGITYAYMSVPNTFAGNSLAGYDTTNILDIYPTGNVGIGKTAPGQKLDVNGTVKALAFTQTGTSINNFTGNVGIGSVTPGQILDVTGTARVTNLTVGSGITLGGVTNTTWPAGALPGGSPNTLQYQVNSTTFGGVSNSAADANGNIGIGTTITQGSLIVFGGNVGIGTYAPTALFQISGQGTSNGNVGIGSVNPGGVLDVEGTINPIVFGAVAGGTNVGIGSYTPGAKLDVNGTIRALSSGTCTTLYKCVGGADAGVIQTAACVLCPTGSCVATNLCG